MPNKYRQAKQNPKAHADPNDNHSHLLTVLVNFRETSYSPNKDAGGEDDENNRENREKHLGSRGGICFAFFWFWLLNRAGFSGGPRNSWFVGHNNFSFFIDLQVKWSKIMQRLFNNM